MSASARLEVLGLGDGPQGQIGLDGGDRALPQAVRRPARGLPGGLQVLLDGGALRLQPVLEVVDPALDLGVDQGGRRIDVDQLDQGFQAPLRSAMAAWTRLTRPTRLRDVGPQLRRPCRTPKLRTPTRR